MIDWNDFPQHLCGCVEGMRGFDPTSYAAGQCDYNRYDGMTEAQSELVMGLNSYEHRRHQQMPIAHKRGRLSDTLPALAVDKVDASNGVETAFDSGTADSTVLRRRHDTPLDSATNSHCTINSQCKHVYSDAKPTS